MAKATLPAPAPVPALPADRSLPQDLDMESAILGAAMTDATGLEACLTLTAEDFYRDGYRAAFEAILALSAQGKPVHYTTVGYMLRQQGTYDVAGGETALVAHCDRGMVTSNAPYYAQIVREKAELRRLIRAGHQLESLPYRDGATMEEIRDQAETVVMAALAPADKSGGLQPIGDVLTTVLQQYAHRKERGDGIGGATTGYDELDYATSGLTPGLFVIVAARPSIGKTAFVSRIALHFAKHHGAVAFYSMDTDNVNLAQRIAAMEGQIDIMGLRSGTLWEDEERRLTETAERIAALPLVLDERPAMSASYIRRQTRLLRTRGPVSLIVVDYLQMMDSSGGREENRNQELSIISRHLKQLGREIGCPVVALSQLNRQVESRPNRRPMLSDLRDSGGLEAEADIVLGLYREDYYKSKDPGYEAPAVENAEVLILKQKAGPTGVVNLAYVGKYVRFENLEKRFDAPGQPAPPPVPARPARRNGRTAAPTMESPVGSFMAGVEEEDIEL